MMKRSKSDDALLNFQSNLNLSIPIENIIEENKSEINEEGQNGLKDLRELNQDKFDSLNSSRSWRAATIRNFDLFQVDGNYS